MLSLVLCPPISTSAYAADQILSEKYRVYLERLTTDGRNAPGFTETNFAVLLSDLDTGAVVYTKNVDKPYAVGDLRRMFLNYTLFKELGGDYQFSTELLVDNLPQEVQKPGDINVDFSQPVTGVGNVYLRGGGDPSFSLKGVEDLIEDLAKRGVSGVDEIILDTSFADSDPGTPSEVSFNRAFPFNRGCLPIFVYPGRVGLPARVSVGGLLGIVEIESTVSTGRGDVADIEAQFKLNSEAERRQGRVGRVFAAGIIGSKSELQEICAAVAPTDREALLTAILARKLQQSSIQFRSIKRGRTPGTAKPLTVQQSTRLTEILTRENQFPYRAERADLFLQQIALAKNGELEPSVGREVAVSLVRSIIGERGGADFNGIFGGGGALVYSAADLAKFLQQLVGSTAMTAELQVSMPRVGEDGLALNRILNPLYVRKLRTTELEEKKGIVKTIRAFVSLSDSSTGIVGFASIPGVRRIAFTLLGDGGNNRAVREGIVLDLLKIALQFPVSLAEAAPIVESPTSAPLSTPSK